MAAERLLLSGRSVLLADAKPSLARKFLMAGKSGLNLTNMAPRGAFLDAYGASSGALAPMVSEFGAEAVRDWAENLGQETFVGSTGRLFPTAMKASPLLRAWLARLDSLSIDRRTRWRWTGWGNGAATFDTPDGIERVKARATVLALGGGSWARLGSDGAWTGTFRQHGITTIPFAPSNAGVAVAWSSHMRRHFGAPLKGIALAAGSLRSRGEITIAQSGIEGGGIYPLAPALRASEPLYLDLAPDLDSAQLAQRFASQGRRRTLSERLRRAAGLSSAEIAMAQECGRPLPQEPKALAATIKALRIAYTGLAPLDRAISTTGGVPWSALDDGLMIKDRPGVFCAGEMIDWDAPTGGYLLTACFATGRWAGQKASQWLETAPPADGP